MGTEVVDSIVANLEVRYQQYVEGFERATAAHGKFKKSVDALKTQTFDLQAEGQKYVGGAADIQRANDTISRSAKKRSAEEIAAAEAVKKAARDRAAAERAAAKAASDAVKAAEKEKQAALKVTQLEQEKAARAAKEKAEAERAAAAAAVAAAEREAAARARLAAVVDRAVSRTGPLPQAVNGRVGSTVPREASGQRGIPLDLLNGVSSGAVAAADTSAAEKVNHLALDRYDLQQRSKVAEGAIKRELQDQIDYLRRIEAYKRAGLTEDEAAVRAQREMSAVTAARSAQERRRAETNVSRFARGAGVGNYAGTATVAGVAGLATAVGVGVGVEVVKNAVEYGKALDNLSKQLGITVEDLQAYEKIARDTGVSTEQLSSAFGQFASNLGRAQQGSEEQAKVFTALGVNIKNFSSAGDALPTVIDRISQLKDPLQRAAIETRLFGEEGRRLDPLLAGGAARVSELSASLQETGRALSAKEIQELDQTAQRLAEVKNQLQVDLARVVAGNAASIIGLANSFELLANSLLNLNTARSRTADASLFDVEKSRRDVPTLILGRAAGKTDAQIEREAFDRQSATPEGRAAIRSTIAASRSRLNGQNNLLSTVTSPETYYSADQRKRALAYYDRLEAQLARAEKAPSTSPTLPPPVQFGAVNQGLIGKLGAPKPPKGKSAATLEREELERERRFQDQLASANGEYLRAQQQMTDSIDKRAEIEKDLLSTSSKARLADIRIQRDRDVAAGQSAKIADAHAAELVAAEKKAHDANLAAVEQDRRLAKERVLTTMTDSLLEAQGAVLRIQQGLATTNKERRRLGLAALDNEYAREGNRLGGIIRSAKPGSDEAKQALVDFGTLQERYPLEQKNIIAGTGSPLDNYRRQLHEATDDTNAALQDVAVNGLRNLEDQIAGSIGKVLGLKGAFGDLVGSVLSDLARIELKKGILALLGQGGEGGGSGGGFLSGVGRLLSRLPKFASGGSMAIGGTPGLDRNVLSINGEPRALVGAHEILNVVNPTLANTRVRNSSTNSLTVIAPQQFDLSGVLMTEPVLTQLEERNRQYARQVAVAAGQGAVDASPSRLQRQSTLGT